MRISYEKKHIIVLLTCLLLGTATVFGMNQFYLQPLETRYNQANQELNQAQALRRELINQKQQLETFEGNAINVEELPQLIPFGNLQPESLLETLANSANGAGVILTNHNFGASSPVNMPIEEEGEEINQGPTLMRTTLALTLEGDNMAQFQEFIQLLEQTPRLIQVESFTVDQQHNLVQPMSLSETTNLMEPMSLLSTTNLAGDYNQEEEYYSKGEVKPTKNMDSDNSEELETVENETLEDETASNEEETTEENQNEDINPPVVQSRNMRASVTISIFFFEN